MEQLPYGSWPSPLTPAALARDTRRLGPVAFSGPEGWPCWLESRPEEGGRNVVVCLRGGEVVDLLPRDANARSSVHEYGGGSFVFLPDGALVHSEFKDGRLTVAGTGAAPMPLTPEAPQPGAVRYADPEPDTARGLLYTVRERHLDTGVSNDLVAVDLKGEVEPRALAHGHDFFSSPALSPDGRRLAWLTWDHPRMPWDGTELWLADIAPDGSIGPPARVAGGPTESIFQPVWSPEGVLHCVSDRTGWWNLYRFGSTATEAVCPLDAEFGAPQWVFGMTTYAFLDRGRIGCIVNNGDRAHLGIVDAGSLRLLDLPFTAFAETIASDGRHLLTVAAGPRDVPSVVLVDADGGSFDVLRRAAPPDLASTYIAEPEPFSFPVDDGEGHAILYSPRHPAVEGLSEERPPLLVNCHGGPTSQAKAAFSPDVAFWTSRGFAVVTVNYGGSTGYGRAYRERLRGQWGVVDVDDCLAAARFVTDRGDADPQRVVFRGGSAGGFTALAAAAFRDGLAAAVSYFGVADLRRLAEDTHKFESRYLDGLVGPLPEAAATYRERSPLYAADRIRCPVLLLQGSEDRVVPPWQAETMAAALQAGGVPVAYVRFEGEDHGFRTADAIACAAATELAFYGEIFGFHPPGDDLPALGIRE